MQSMTESQAETAARFISAISSPARLRLIFAMLYEERFVGNLARLSGLSQSSASQHLARLKEVGLVVQRTQGHNRFFRIDPDKITLVERILEVTKTLVSPDV
jgi:DNA-binding transcriptional ArsR family regulator